MPIFSYTAIDNTGNKRTGDVDARSQSSAVSLLKEQGLFVVELKEQKEGVLEQALSFRGVPTGEVVAVTRQLATMISAGLPISRGLEVLAEQTQNKNMRKVLLDVLRDVQGGSSFSSALSKHPEAFNTTYVALVGAGEASGKLEEILLRLADTLESQRDFQSQFKAAMVYPAVIFVAMIGVTVLLLIFVIPKLSQMYDSMGVDLPGSTQFLINMSDFMLEFWYIVLIIVGTIIMGIRSFLATPKGKIMFTTAMGNLPVFGKLMIQKDLTEFSRTLSLLISSGIAITEALDIVGKVLTNAHLKEGAQKAAETVEKGGSFSDYLKQDKNFPPLLGQMTAVGEETGKLDEVLTRIGEFYATETSHAIKGLSAAIEPIILIMLGGLVGMLIVSIITPIYQITANL